MGTNSRMPCMAAGTIDGDIINFPSMSFFSTNGIILRQALVGSKSKRAVSDASVSSYFSESFWGSHGLFRVHFEVVEYGRSSS